MLAWNPLYGPGYLILVGLLLPLSPGTRVTVAGHWIWFFLLVCFLSFVSFSLPFLWQGEDETSSHVALNSLGLCTQSKLALIVLPSPPLLHLVCTSMLSFPPFSSESLPSLCHLQKCPQHPRLLKNFPWPSALIPLDCFCWLTRWSPLLHSGLLGSRRPCPFCHPSDMHRMCPARSYKEMGPSPAL